MKKALVVLIFIGSLTAAMWLALSGNFFHSADVVTSFQKNEQLRKERKTARTESKLEKLIQKDFQYLGKNNFWGFKKDDLRDVQVLLDPQIKNEKELQALADLLYAEFPKSRSGKKKLEIVLIGGNDANVKSISDKKEKRILVLQFSLTDVKSQNKTWEMGRTYSY